MRSPALADRDDVGRRDQSTLAGVLGGEVVAGDHSDSLITGDAAHFKDNWDNRRVPVFNVDKDKSAASMQRLADLMAQHKATLWIHLVQDCRP